MVISLSSIANFQQPMRLPPERTNRVCELSWPPQGAIHFKEDVLRVKRSRFRSVILSAAKDLCASETKPLQVCHPERSEGSLCGERSFAPLRMTKRDGLFFEMYCPWWVPKKRIENDSVCVTVPRHQC